MADKELQTYTFKNSDTCWGYGTVYGEGQTAYGHDIIHIENGRYPDEGEWALNHEAEERVLIVSGRGGVAIRGAGYQQLDATTPGEIDKHAVVPPNAWFRWESEAGEQMVISMVTQPAFDREKYQIATDKFIEEIDSKRRLTNGTV